MASAGLNLAVVHTLIDTINNGEVYEKNTEFSGVNGIYKYCNKITKYRCIYVNSQGKVLNFYNGVSEPTNPEDIDKSQIIVEPLAGDQRWNTLGIPADTYISEYAHIVPVPKPGFLGRLFGRKGGRRRRTKKSRKSKKTKKVKKSRRRH